MNILFLVMNFLLIFVFLNGMVLKNASFFSSQKQLACNYLSSKLSLESKWERYKYKSYMKKNLSTPSATKPSPIKNRSGVKKEIFSSHRMKGNSSSLGKWNLSALFSESPGQASLLGECTERLLKELYSHTPFWKEAEKEIPELASLLVAGFLEKKEGTALLSDLFPEDTKLQSLFYKMLKGSGSYDLTQKTGYPPLSDFFTVNPKEKTLVSFPFASYPILQALFSPATAQKILSFEKKKWEKDGYLHSLTKQELRSISLETFLPVKGKRFQDIEPFLHFSRKSAQLETLTYKEKKTHLILKIPKQT